MNPGRPLAYILTAALDLLIAYAVFRNIMPRKQSANWRIEASMGMSFLLVLLSLSLLTVNLYCILPVYMLCVFLYGLYACEGDILFKAFGVLINVSFLIMGDLFAAGLGLALGICEDLCPPLLGARFEPGWGMVFSYAYVALMVATLRLFPLRKAGRIERWSGVMVMSPPLLTACFSIALSVYRAERSQLSALLLLGTTGYFGAMQLINILYYKAVLISQEQARARAVLESQLTSFAGQYGAMERSYHSLRALRHDLKNHVMVIGELIQRGEWQAVRDYNKTLSDEISECNVVSTGNMIADIILNNKYAQAAALGIDMQIEAHLPRECRIGMADLCVLLSNALDNAIEACERIEHGGRWVRVCLSLKAPYLYLSVKNSLGELPQVLDGELRTSKGDCESHGIGMRNMRAIAAKYNGHLSVKYDEKAFLLECMLQNKRA